MKMTLNYACVQVPSLWQQMLVSIVLTSSEETHANSSRRELLLNVYTFPHKLDLVPYPTTHRTLNESRVLVMTQFSRCPNLCLDGCNTSDRRPA